MIIWLCYFLSYRADGTRIYVRHACLVVCYFLVVLQYQCCPLFFRCLRLQGVLCNAETSDLLQQCKLERLMFIRIISDPEVNGACLLLSWHAETLLSLEFIHCQLYPTVMDKICRSLCQEGSSHGIQRFSIKSSQICETKPLTISSGLLNFLSSGK